jgi:hypothetical protein
MGRGIIDEHESPADHAAADDDRASHHQPADDACYAVDLEQQKGPAFAAGPVHCEAERDEFPSAAAL